MRVYNADPQQPVLSEGVIKAAVPYDDPDAMKRGGYTMAGKGATIAMVGMPLMALGGTVAMLAGGSHETAFKRGRVIWGAGIALMGFGGEKLLKGDRIVAGSNKIRKALHEGLAKVVPKEFVV